MTSLTCIRRGLLTASLTALTAASALALPTGLWNTGVDNSGLPMVVGSPEIHYIVTANVPTEPIEVVNRLTAWVNPSPAPAAWIGPDGVSDPVGLYFYSLTFNNYSTLPSITGFWASDNSSRILLNGNPTGFARPGTGTFGSLMAFNITTGFNTGLNTLTFEVYNAPGSFPNGNPSGLLVTGLTGNVPDGGMTVALVGLALAGLASVRRFQVRR